MEGRMEWNGMNGQWNGMEWNGMNGMEWNGTPVTEHRPVSLLLLKQ